MSYLRTRAQLRQRAQREAQRQSDTGAYATANWDSALQDAWAEAWYLLTRYPEGYGVKRRQITIVLASATVDLPAEFLSLRAVYRRVNAGAGACLARPTDWKEVYTLSADTWPPEVSYGNLYLTEGPGLEDDGLTEYPQRLRFFPSLSAGEVIDLVYVTQAPQLQEAVAVDVVAEPIEAAVCALARARAVTREDSSEYQRANQALINAIDLFVKHHGQRDRTGLVNGASMTTPGWVGY